MKKKDLAVAFAENFDLSKKVANEYVEFLFTKQVEALTAGEELNFKDFGKFKLAVTAAKPEREGKNPLTGKMQVFPAKPESKKIKFTPAKSLKEAVK